MWPPVCAFFMSDALSRNYTDELQVQLHFLIDGSQRWIVRWLSLTLSPPLFLPPLLSLPPSLLSCLRGYNEQLSIWRILSNARPSDMNLINLD